MTIKVGDRLPAGTLSEYVEVETTGCTIGPNEFKVDDLTKGRKVAIFGLPGAFTPTCSAKHVPSYVQNIDRLKAKGVSDRRVEHTERNFDPARLVPRFQSALGDHSSAVHSRQKNPDGATKPGVPRVKNFLSCADKTSLQFSTRPMLSKKFTLGSVARVPHSIAP